MIQHPDVVLYDMTSPALSFLIIEGTFIFEDLKDLELNATYIIVKGYPITGYKPYQGRLQIGTPQRPHEHRAVITLHGNRRSYEMPIYGAKVLAVRYGIVDMHGMKRLSWCRLNQTAHKGSRTLVLDTDTYWQIGWDIVVAPTGFQYLESDYRKIIAVYNHGRTVVLDRPLAFTHTAEWRDPIEGRDISNMRAEVGLLSRNIVVQVH
jgi:hypothetical protein